MQQQNTACSTILYHLKRSSLRGRAEDVLYCFADSGEEDVDVVETQEEQQERRENNIKALLSGR